MSTMFESFRHTVKRGLAIFLFTLLLLGMMGAALGIFSAGISMLTAHRGLGTVPNVSTTSAVSTLGPATNDNGTTNPGSASSNQSTTRSNNNNTPSNPYVGGAQGGQSTTVRSSGTPGAGTDLASRLNQQMRDMQSPVTGTLDSGGVALGNQVQNAFGHFLSGLLQTLFVEQAGSSTVPSQAR